jgi:hypothetical protein
MVRVGGGWVALDEFLVKNDPCRGEPTPLYPLNNSKIRQIRKFPTNFPVLKDAKRNFNLTKFDNTKLSPIINDKEHGHLTRFDSRSRESQLTIVDGYRLIHANSPQFINKLNALNVFNPKKKVRIKINKITRGGVGVDGLVGKKEIARGFSGENR